MRALSRRYVGRPAQLFDRAVAVYAQEGFEVGSADRAGGRLVSMPRYTWPTAVSEEWKAREHPGVQVLTLLLAAGRDSTDVIITARVLCQVRAPGDPVPSERTGDAVRALTTGLLAVAFLRASEP